MVQLRRRGHRCGATEKNPLRHGIAEQVVAQPQSVTGARREELPRIRVPLPAGGIAPHPLLISGERHPVVAGGRGQLVRQDRGTHDPGADPHAAERHSPGGIAEQGNTPV